MGIQGLLVGLQPFTKAGNIQDFRGEAIAIDTSSWLHKSVYSIADHYVECIEGKKLDRRCINTSAKYITERCQELLFGAKIQRIYLVMDGKRCPLKAGTNQERDARRQKNLVEARTFRRQKRHDLMYEKYKACIKVTEELATTVARIVKERLSEAVEIVWSPYEADAQLAQMCIDGRAAAAITEDSDVLVYSASCQKSFPIVCKLDRRSGDCDIFSLEWLLNDSYPLPKVQQKENQPQLQAIFGILRSRQLLKKGWGARLFVQACVLAGCDYSPRKVPGVGLVNAFKMVRTAGCTGSFSGMSRVFRQILFSAISVKSRGALGNVEEFEELLAKSEAVFYYHPVAQSDGTVIYLNAREESYNPSLDRFTSHDFLGILVANQNESNIIPESSLRPHCTQNLQRSVAKQPQTVPSTLTFKNPYLRQPLQNQSRNRPNIFAEYAERHSAPERQIRSYHIVSAQLPVKAKNPPGSPDDGIHGVRVREQHSFSNATSGGVFTTKPKQMTQVPKRSFSNEGSQDDERLHICATKYKRPWNKDTNPSLRKISRTSKHYNGATGTDPQTNHKALSLHETKGYGGSSDNLANSISGRQKAGNPAPQLAIQNAEGVIPSTFCQNEEMKSPYWNTAKQRNCRGREIDMENNDSSPNLLQQHTPPTDDESLSSEAEGTAAHERLDQFANTRRITIASNGQRPSVRPESLLDRFQNEPVAGSDDSSLLVDLTNEVEINKFRTRLTTKSTSFVPPKKTMCFRIGEDSAKARPARKRSKVANFVRQQRANRKTIRNEQHPQQQTLSRWFAKK